MGRREEIVGGDKTKRGRETAEGRNSCSALFDRYVAGELHSLSNQIVDLKESIDGRFVNFEKRIDERFTQADRRFSDLKESMDDRFTQIDKRFTQVDRRIDELKESVDKLFDKSDATIKWIIGLFSPVIVGILAIIVKMFFGP